MSTYRIGKKETDITHFIIHIKLKISMIWDICKQIDLVKCYSIIEKYLSLILDSIEFSVILRKFRPSVEEIIRTYFGYDQENLQSLIHLDLDIKKNTTNLKDLFKLP